jgi:hypothetical protein
MSQEIAPTTGPASPRTPPVPSWFALASAATMIAIGILVGLRGFHRTALVWGRPFWEVTYSSGFIRRGLVGTVFQGLFGGLTFGTQTDLVIEITMVVALALLVGLATWLALLVANAPTRANALRLTLISLPIVGSALFSMLVFTTGYLDGILLLFAAACAVLMARGHLWPAVVLGCLAPVVHELFIYMWIPLAVFGYSVLARRNPDRPMRVLIPALCAPVLAALVVVSLPSRTTTARELATHVTGSAQYKATLLHWEFGQTFAAALHRMDHLQTRFWWPTEPAAFLYFCWPAILAVAVYMTWRWSLLDRVARAALVLAVLSPWTALVLAWDLSRLVLLANALVLIVIYGLETTVVEEPGGELRMITIGALVGCTVLAMALPYMFVQFNVGYYLHAGPLRWSLMPVLHPVLASWFHLV